ncbi:ATP11 protein [Sarocladium implicatum]|nr:ATP11 protein [Sarocladium implicatum]
MASLRLPSLRHLAIRRSPLFTSQRRWAQVHDVRFLATTPRQHEILDKYRSKLDERAREEGFATLNDLKAAYADKIAEQRRRDAAAPPMPQGVGDPPGGELDPNRPQGAPEIPQAPETPVTQPNADKPMPGSHPNAPSSPSQAPPGEPRIPQAPETPVKQPNADKGPRAASSSSNPGIKTLDDFLDLEKVRSLPEKEVSTIWRLRHASSPNTLCAAIPSAVYRAMEDAARTAPQFVLPVPHPEQGAEIHFIQWTFDNETRTSTVLFTQLAEYKARGEFAQPHTTVTHHLDLMDEQAGVALMQGQVVDGRGMEPEQAKWLVMCLQKFYGGWDTTQGELTGERKTRADARRQLLEWFATGNEQFSVEKLLDEAERMG